MYCCRRENVDIALWTDDIQLLVVRGVIPCTKVKPRLPSCALEVCDLVLTYTSTVNNMSVTRTTDVRKGLDQYLLLGVVMGLGIGGGTMNVSLLCREKLIHVTCVWKM